MIGRTLSHFHIEEELGSGSMGVVYRARDEDLGRAVAIKVLPEGLLQDQLARKRLRREARALSALSHANIEIVHEFANEDGVDYLVMELLDGRTLARRLEEGPLPEAEVVSLGAQLLSALEAAHERGIVHRDLKPANIALLQDGRLKVLDFGLAKWLVPEPGATSTGFTTAGMGLGTVPYMAPEQLRGTTDERCDLFGAGAVLYEMACAQRAFPQESSIDLIDALLNGRPTPVGAVAPDLSETVANVIMRALEKDAGDRYQTARDMRVALLAEPAPPPPGGLRGLLRRLGIG
jgi:serine/threonine protein kinase